MTPTEFMDYLRAFLVFAFRLLVILAVAALIGSMFVSVGAAAVECKTRPDRTTYWRYRIIDGERCWFKGHRVRPKSSLYWPDEKEEKKPKRDHRDPVFQIRAQVKTVKPDELNELDMQAGNPKPFVVFPELTEKVEALLNLWNHRWDSK